MKITLGHTPDADDAFMFYGISTGKIKSHNFDINHVVEDIEALNNRALVHQLHITAISAHAYAHVEDYVVLKAGSSFGVNYGPIVLGAKELSKQNINELTIGVPGKMTSAYLLLRLALGHFKEKILPFNDIPGAILSREIDAGLIIHEEQIAYDKSKFHKIFDLGNWWSEKTNNLPLPLGINVASKKLLSMDHIIEFDQLFKRSIIYGLENFDDAIDYAMQYARGKSRDLISRFVKMYVNTYTIDMGLSGEEAIKHLLLLGEEKNYFDHVSINFCK